MLPPRADLDPAAILRGMRPDLVVGALPVLGEGWENVVYAVGDGLVLRVSKVAEESARAASTRFDAAVLDLVAAALPVAVGRALAVDAEAGALLCERVQGVPLAGTESVDLGVVVEGITATLTALHAIPASDLPQGLRVEVADHRDWAGGVAARFAAIADRLSPDARALLEGFLAREAPEPPTRMVLCHNDLGDEHLVVDPVTSRLTGVIDWGDAVLGDPARDLALVLFDLGEDAFGQLLAAYDVRGDATLEARARWFAVLAGVNGVAVRTAAADDAGGAATLARVQELLDGEIGDV